MTPAIARTLGLAVAAVVASLGTLEVGMRATGLGVHEFANDQLKYAGLLEWDPAGVYFRHRPGTRAEIGGVALDFNSLGMRDREPAIPKPAGRRRLLCLGDSFTYGPGVPADLTFVGRLRAALAGRGVDVVEGAVQGWNTEQEAAFLADAGERLAPDLVVLLYVVNDVEPTERMREAHAPATSSWQRLYRTLVLRSRLFEWGAFVYRTRIEGPNWEGLGRLNQQRQERAALGLPFAPDDGRWLASRAALERIHDLTGRENARLTIFLYRLGEMRVGPLALARLREFGAASGVPVFDTAPYFAGHDARTLVNQVFVDHHLNAEGHALLAAGIRATLEEGGLLPGAGAGS